MIRNNDIANKAGCFDALWPSMVNVCRYFNDYPLAQVRATVNAVYNLAPRLEDHEALEYAKKAISELYL